MNTSKDYNDLYLKVDDLLLVCVFETFREESINSFELYPAHFYLILAIAECNVEVCWC